ncbi:MAG: DUF2927 domain-containing protein [Amaricoccus sp.]
MRTLSLWLAVCLAAALAACAPVQPPAEITSVRFGAVTLPRGIARSNAELAQDFLDLTFALESGEQLDHLVRYEQPVRIYMGSPELATYRPDLLALLARIRAEAGVDIAATDDPDKAQIRIEAVPASQIARVFPTAACFIVPGETDWAGFIRRRPEDRVRWSDQKQLGEAAIFLPPDTTPQDVRDCLNEEITQALGPANDLYRLPDSIWNDDNFYGMATTFDMTILRALYQPEFHSGMTKPEAAAVLPRVLYRVNPPGRRLPPRPRHPESRAWATAIEEALARDAPRDKRLEAAQLATQIAAEMQPPDHRLGVSLLTLGRLELRQDPAAAARDFEQAYQLFVRLGGPRDLRAAQAGVHLAALAVGTGQYEAAVKLADLYAPVAVENQNAILLAGLLSIKAEALAELGDVPRAQAARLDSLRWARYGFGDTDGALAREEAQLAAMVRLDKK